MSDLSLSASGTAPAALAWERYADPQLWSTWAPQIQRVQTDMSRLTPGGDGTVHAGPLPRPTLAVPFEVLEVDEPEMTWTWHVRLGPGGLVRLRLAHGVRADGDGSTTWLRVHGPLPVVLGYAPVARLALGRLVTA